MFRLVTLLVLAATPLETAQEHLKAGRLDEVLFALDGQAYSAADKPKAATLLGEAAKASFAKKDELLAAQFAQMALKLDPKQPAALEASARTWYAQQQFEEAEKAADAWVELDGSNVAARLLRAQIAVDNADWQIAIDQLSATKWSGADAKKAEALKRKAVKELSEKRSSASAVAALEKQIAEAAKVRASEREAFAMAASNDVIVYTTSWCGYCRKAKQFLTARKVPFIEKDVEKDQAASQELARKAAAARVRPSGVPVLDIKGKLILGFDQPAIEAALN